MSALITAGINSIVINIATPYESDGVTVRDDLSGIKVWVSDTTGFTPNSSSLAYNASGLSVTLSGYTAGTPYYVRYALISDIDPDQYDISQEYTVTPKSLNDIDLTKPPAPTSVTVTGSFSYVFVETSPQTYTMGHGPGKVQVYAINTTVNPTTALTFENATLQVEFTGTVGSFNSDPGTTWNIWVKFVTKDGVAGDANGPYVATTGQDVSKIVSAITTASNSPFTVLTTDTTINGVKYSAGTYAKQSFITNAQINNAQIANASIDDAKIINLSARKLTAGDGVIGGDLKSYNYTGPTTRDVGYTQTNTPGWIIRQDGSAEFNAASITGLLSANQINGTGLSIKRQNADGSITVILDAGKTIQQQIANYAVNATSGTTLNFDPTCSVTTAWDPANIATITDGLIGNSVLAGSNGEWLLEGITTDKAYTINYDPQRRYQISALIRKTSNVSSGLVHIGLLEFDGNGTAQYPWGGYLRGSIPANSLTTQFKRYYVTFAPGDLHQGTAKVALHVILGYPNTGGGRVEIQDIKVDDITLANNIQYAAVSTNAIDNTTKVAAAKSEVYSNTLSSTAANIMTGSQFYLQTNGFGGIRDNSGNITGGTGMAIYDGGLIGQANGKTTFVLDTKGNATFSGKLSVGDDPVSKQVPSRVEITNDGVKVYSANNNGQAVLRVVLGKLN